MKTKVTGPEVTSPLRRAEQLFNRVMWLGAAMLICSGPSAQNMFVSGNAHLKNCLGTCGVIYKFTWDGGESIFTLGLTHPTDLSFDGTGNLFVVDNDRDELFGKAAIYKITPKGVRTTFASGLNHPVGLAFDSAGNLFVVDAGDVNGTGSVSPNAIYKFTSQGVRSMFASAEGIGESFACLAFQPMPACCE